VDNGKRHGGYGNGGISDSYGNNIAVAHNIHNGDADPDKHANARQNFHTGTYGCAIAESDRIACSNAHADAVYTINTGSRSNYDSGEWPYTDFA